MRSVELSGWNLFAIFTRLRQVYVFFFLHYVFVGIFVESIALSAIKYLCWWALSSFDLDLCSGWDGPRLQLSHGCRSLMANWGPWNCFALLQKIYAINPFKDVTSEQASSIRICKYIWYVHNILFAMWVILATKRETSKWNEMPSN